MTAAVAGRARPTRSARIGGLSLLRLGAFGVRRRPMGSGLSALGIGLGIAAMVAVAGISESSSAGVLAELDQLGTNLLTVQPGEALGGKNAELPVEATAMIARDSRVQQVTATGSVVANAFRNDHIPVYQTSGIAVVAAQPDLLSALGAHVTRGVFLNKATSRYPAVVLGWTAAPRLGIDRVGEQAWLATQVFSVLRTLPPLPLTPTIDS